jgi:FolB domain-containing protein
LSVLIVVVDVGAKLRRRLPASPVLLRHHVSRVRSGLATARADPVFARDLPETAKDLITIQDLLVLTRIADGTRWPSSSVQEKLQPIYLTLEITHDCASASATDNLSLSVNYGSVSARIQALFQKDASWSSVEQLCRAVHAMCFQEFPDIQETTLHARRPDAILHAAYVAFKCRRTRTRNVNIHEEFCISNLLITTIVGVNPAERVEAQPVVFDISMRRSVEAKEPFDFRALSRAIVQVTA